MHSRCFVFIALAACFQPTPQAGARCAAEGNRCPSGLACRDGFCVDDSIDAAKPIDAPVVDARVVDAPSDALDLVGCSDGAREAFASIAMFPDVAGCAASWNAALGLRASATGQACGDDVQLCAAPADACSAGWHVCGTSGQPTELTARMTQADCTSGGATAVVNARFVAALSHCASYTGSVCGYEVPRTCGATGSCAEPVCCGAGCRNDAGCSAGAFAMQGIAGTLTNGCAMMLATDVSGVLCCR